MGDSIREGVVRVYRSSAQLLPLFITDLEHNTEVRTAAQEASDFLHTHVMELVAKSKKSPEALGGAWRFTSKVCTQEFGKRLHCLHDLLFSDCKFNYRRDLTCNETPCTGSSQR